MTDIHPLNQTLKRSYPSFSMDYMNKFYIYKGGIHQIVRVKRGFEKVIFIVQIPSGRLTEKTIPLYSFKNRGYYETFDEAKKVLLLNTNDIPVYRKEYIEELKKYFF